MAKVAQGGADFGNSPMRLSREIVSTISATTATCATQGFLGRWFHSVDDEGAIIWQGKLLAEVEPGLYQVQLYSWLDGEPTVQKRIALADMRGWKFYRTNAAMRAVGDRLFEREAGAV